MARVQSEAIFFNITFWDPFGERAYFFVSCLAY
jgi:hypothetical protein